MPHDTSDQGNETIQRPFRNSPPFEAKKSIFLEEIVRSVDPKISDTQATIELSIIQPDKNAALGGRISEILQKVFEDENKLYLEGLSFREASFLSDFFEVISRIFIGGNRYENIILNNFMKQFNIIDLNRFQVLAKQSKLGSQSLATLIREIKNSEKM